MPEPEIIRTQIVVLASPQIRDHMSSGAESGYQNEVPRPNRLVDGEERKPRLIRSANPTHAGATIFDEGAGPTSAR